MIVIELCGAPGVGKSTLCKEISKTIKKNGLKIDCREDWNERIRQSILTRINRKMYCICCKWYRKFPSIIKHTCYSDLINMNTWLRSIIVADYFIITSKRRDILLFDEGIIQFFTSLSHEREISDDLLHAAICTRGEIIKKPYLVFNCSLDLTSNIDRIRKRNRDDRFSKYSNEELPKQLQLKKRNIEKILQSYADCTIVNLDMSDFEGAISNATNEIVSFYKSNC